MHAYSFRFQNAKPTQRGAVLVSAMIFLIVLMILGISLVGSTRTDEKMARNARDADVAFAAAEAALRDAELRITGSYKWPYSPVNLNLFDTSCTSGLCDSTTVPLAFQVDLLDFYDSTAPASNAVTIGTATASPTVANVLDQPKYMIEMVCSNMGSAKASGCGRIFRITAQARGRLANTKIVLQEIYLPADFVN